MPNLYNWKGRMGTTKGSETMPQQKPKFIKLDLGKDIIAHVLNEPRDLIFVPKTEKYVDILDDLKGDHDGDLAIEMKHGKKSVCVLIAKIGEHVAINKKFIMGERWRKYYSVRLDRNLDKTLKIIECS